MQKKRRTIRNKRRLLTKKIINLLNSGAIVILPTDTVYGIFCRALNKNAVKRIYKIKGRDFSKPLQIFLSDKNQIKKREENITLMPGLYWHIDKNFIYIRNRSVDDKFPDESEYDKLYDEIFEMRSYIGKRLGRSINIYQYTTFPGIDISIINND